MRIYLECLLEALLTNVLRVHFVAERLGHVKLCNTSQGTRLLARRQSNLHFIKLQSISFLIGSEHLNPSLVHIYSFMGRQHFC